MARGKRGNPFEARDGCFKVAAKKNQDNLAYLLGQVRFWNDHF